MKHGVVFAKEVLDLAGKVNHYFNTQGLGPASMVIASYIAMKMKEPMKRAMKFLQEPITQHQVRIGNLQIPIM